VQAKLAGLAAVSDVTLLNRLRDAEPWLRELCQSLWKENGVQLDTAWRVARFDCWMPPWCASRAGREASGESITACACRRWSATTSI